MVKSRVEEEEGDSMGLQPDTSQELTPSAGGNGGAPIVNERTTKQAAGAHIEAKTCDYTGLITSCVPYSLN